MVSIVKIVIENFKSIHHIEIDLAPLTIFIGPPASGKSNILDALALVGYLNRLTLINKEYGNNISYLEPLTTISRFNEHKELFRYHRLANDIQISVKNNNIDTRLKLFYTQGKFTLSINDVKVQWDLKVYAQQQLAQIANVLRNIRNRIIETRLYGFDRYGLARTLPSYTVSSGSRNTPANILSELGWNIPYIVKGHGDIVINLNRLLKDYLNEEIAIVTLLNNTIAIFDYWVQVVGSSVSDTIYRALYYLLAISSSMNYTKLYGLENRFVLLLEEPEAHVFPYFLDLLSEYIKDALKVLNVVIVTHNPLLVSILWDKIKDVSTYYVFREKDGSTNTVEIDVEKMAKDLRATEELLFMPPVEIISNYGKKSHKETKEAVNL